MACFVTRSLLFGVVTFSPFLISQSAFSCISQQTWSEMESAIGYRAFFIWLRFCQFWLTDGTNTCSDKTPRLHGQQSKVKQRMFFHHQFVQNYLSYSWVFLSMAKTLVFFLIGITIDTVIFNINVVYKSKNDEGWPIWRQQITSWMNYELSYFLSSSFRVRWHTCAPRASLSYCKPNHFIQRP